jgi:hypothetical protein
MTIESKRTVALAMLGAMIMTVSFAAAAEPAGSPVRAAIVKPMPPPVLDKAVFPQAVDAASQDPAFLKALVTGDQAQLTRIMRNTCGGVPVKGAAARCSLPRDTVVKVQPNGPQAYLICIKDPNAPDDPFGYWCHPYRIRYWLMQAQ